MKNIKLALEYDGTNYGGWQRQKNIVTVQQALEDAIFIITSERCNVIGCSRTDAKVHAREFICNFHTNSSIPSERIREALNTKLPEDIRVLESMEVDMDFHARYDSKGKTYCYTILNQLVNSALLRNYVGHVAQPLNISWMEEAALHFLGTHDFAAFRNLGSSVKTTTRTISQLDISVEAPLIKIYCTADGFLYNMMRIIVGTLINVGIGKISPGQIPEIIASKDRTKAGKSVSPQGLCLEKVYY
ncbi:tRNA pseudouridine(38-40) synthase TruA [Clostridium thermarum]|uniref:tRNA pseudouridine(38-40) synthase TruA n=1 Tax=Clostridium thermarum TaxID=1716543 RepID=UPI00111F7DE6|nr:tRNA pseudouridine(38-40) synthase TruA [Clostridium thermarum]